LGRLLADLADAENAVKIRQAPFGPEVSCNHRRNGSLSRKNGGYGGYGGTM